jgi:hypothetical protein
VLAAVGGDGQAIVGAAVDAHEDAIGIARVHAAEVGHVLIVAARDRLLFPGLSAIVRALHDAGVVGGAVAAADVDALRVARRAVEGDGEEVAREIDAGLLEGLGVVGGLPHLGEEGASADAVGDDEDHLVGALGLRREVDDEAFVERALGEIPLAAVVTGDGQTLEDPREDRAILGDRHHRIFEAAVAHRVLADPRPSERPCPA